MPCIPFPGGVICTAGDYKYLIRAFCPWCCSGRAKTIHAFRWVFGGYCGGDLICGRCGQDWSSTDDRLHRIPEEDRATNKLLVRSMKKHKKVLKYPPLPK